MTKHPDEVKFDMERIASNAHSHGYKDGFKSCWSIFARVGESEDTKHTYNMALRDELSRMSFNGLDASILREILADGEEAR